MLLVPEPMQGSGGAQGARSWGQGSAGEGWLEALGSLSLGLPFQYSGRWNRQREDLVAPQSLERKAGDQIQFLNVFTAQMSSLSSSHVSTRHSAALVPTGRPPLARPLLSTRQQAQRSDTVALNRG